MTTILLTPTKWGPTFKAWRELRRKEKSDRVYQSRLALFHELMGKKESGVPAMVDGLINAKAVDMVKRWMDRRGVARCHFCLSQTALRKFGKGYICPDHQAQVDKLKNQTVTVPANAT